MATDWPAYARLSTVPPAGQSAASYTTTGDTIVAEGRDPAGVSFDPTAAPVMFEAGNSIR